MYIYICICIYLMRKIQTRGGQSRSFGRRERRLGGSCT